MTITPQDIEQFNQFIAQKLSSGGADSMVQLAREWESQRQEYDEAVGELSQCIADMEAGHGRPLQEFADEMRAKYDIPDSKA